MHITKTSFAGNPNIGLYAFCTDKFCLAGPEVPEKERALLEKILRVPVHVVSLAGTSLVGVFAAGTDEMLLLPEIVFDYELEALSKFGIRFSVIPGRLTALGNNVVVNKNGCIISPDFSDEAKAKIGTALNVPVKTGMIGSIATVGSLAVPASDGVAVGVIAEDFEVEFVETLLKSKCTKATVNGGSPYIKSGVIANSYGIVAGSLTTGLELDTLDKCFGFVDKT